MSDLRDDDSDGVGDDGPRDKRLGVIGGIAWGVLAWLGMNVVMTLLVTLRPDRSHDVVGFTLCSALVFCACTYTMARFYLPTRSLGEALGARSVTPLAYLLGALVGVALILPATWLDDLVIARFPISDEHRAFIEQALTFNSIGHKVAFALAAIVIGPAFEDLLFRGVLYRAVRRAAPGHVAIVVSAVAFTLAHGDNLRALPYVLLGGLVLGCLREASGSVWVSLAAHVAYNATQVVAQLSAWVPMNADLANVSPRVVVAGSVATVALVGLVVLLGRRSETMRTARAEDER